MAIRIKGRYKLAATFIIFFFYVTMMVIAGGNFYLTIFILLSHVISIIIILHYEDFINYGIHRKKQQYNNTINKQSTQKIENKQDNY